MQLFPSCCTGVAGSCAAAFQDRRAAAESGGVSAARREAGVDVRVREPKGREGLPRVSSRMSPVVTTRFSSCWVGVGVCLRQEQQAGQLSIQAGARQRGAVPACLPACTEEVVA